MKIPWETVGILVGCLMVGLGADYQSATLAVTGLGVFLCAGFCALNKHVL